MKARRVAGGWLVRLDRGEDVMATLTRFVAEHRIQAGVLQGIGAVRQVQIGYFDTKAGRYRRSSIRKTLEVISLIGNISYLDNEPFIHAHISLADAEHRLVAGHFFKGIVAVTLELHIRAFAKRLDRYRDKQAGFNFWDL